MPTIEEQKELLNNCTWTWTTQNGVKGYKVTSKTNGNSIFLPAAGYRYGTEVYNRGGSGFFWSSSLHSYNGNFAYFLSFGSGDYDWYNGSRYLGHSVRPVCPVGGEIAKGEARLAAEQKRKEEQERLAQAAAEKVEQERIAAENKRKEDERKARVEYAKTHGSINGHNWIDLGLSVKWATCNVGATVPEEYGGYYAWGEIEEKSFYGWSTYKWCNGSKESITKYCTDSSFGIVDNKTVLIDDVAHVKWGGTWRMPTIEEQKELLNNCTWTWTTQNGVKGYKVTSKTNGNSIFLPAAGYRYGTEVYGRGSDGYYWSSSLYSDDCSHACRLYFFYSGYYDWGYNYRYNGRSVRPVCK